MFESVNGRMDVRTHGRTPARPVYYKCVKQPITRKAAFACAYVFFGNELCVHLHGHEK